MVVLVLATQVLIGGEPEANQAASTNACEWEYITYPAAVLPDQKTRLSFLVGFGEKSQGLRLDVSTSTAREQPEIFAKHLVSARLFRPEGAVVQHIPGNGNPDSPVGAGGGGSIDWSLIFFFPWSTNRLEEAWIEVMVGEQRYWIEVPYGFTGDPHQIQSTEKSRGLPRFASAMKRPGEHDHQVRWSNVHYDVGEIQNGWRLSLVLSNPFDGQSEVVLYREDRTVPGPRFLWDLHSPRTHLRITDASGTVINGHCMDILLHEDGMRRSDTFNLSRYPTRDDARTWGRLEVTVDDRSYRILVPSSLYEYTHGHASTD